MEAKEYLDKSIVGKFIFDPRHKKSIIQMMESFAEIKLLEKKFTSVKLWELVKEIEEKNTDNQSWLGEFRATMEVNFGENGRCVPGIFKDHQGYNPARYIVELFTVENLEKILQKLKSQ